MNYITSTTSFQAAEPVLMRRGRTTDAPRLSALARLDDRRLPDGPYLVAEVSGEIVAALSLPTGAVVADPFRHTADAVAMLVLRARQVSDSGRLSGWRLRRIRGRSARATGYAVAA